VRGGKVSCKADALSDCSCSSETEEGGPSDFDPNKDKRIDNSVTMNKAFYPNVVPAFALKTKLLHCILLVSTSAAQQDKHNEHYPLKLRQCKFQPSVRATVLKDSTFPKMTN